MRKRLEQLPEHTVVDVRRWQTATPAGQGLLDLLAEQHAINRRIEPFTMFSSTRVAVAAGLPMNAGP